MSRQVDVKALVSHVVRGDGADRCRICMGDTSDGQVYLGDTVMMDGEKPVTLAEIVESITGVEVLLEMDLPSWLCSKCTASALAADAYRTLCRKSSDFWSSVVHLLDAIPKEMKCSEGAYMLLMDNTLTIFRRGVDGTDCNKYDDSCETQGDSDEMIDVSLAKESNIANKIKMKQKSIENSLQETEEISLNINTKKITCPDCGKGFKRPRHLYNHFVESTDLKRACFMCAHIMSREKLIDHLKIMHGKQVYTCNKCPALQFNVKHQKTHLEKAHKHGSQTCGDCGRTFRNKYAYNGHTLMHVVKTCPCCNVLLRNHRCYVHHVQKCCNLNISREDVVRTKTKIHFEIQNSVTEKRVKVGARGSTNTECVCDYCNKKFSGKKYVSAHIQIVHLKNTHKPCVCCGKQLASAHMSQHMRSHDVDIFHCTQCGVDMKSKLGYIQHLRIHTGEKPYSCKYCDKTFSTSSKKSEHVRNKHKNKDEIVLKHSCTMCPAKFRLPSRLKKHVSSVHNKDNNQGFECPDCRVKFSSFRGMVYHRKTHGICKRNLNLAKSVVNET